MNARPVFPKRAIVTAGMPYGNKGLHFGHIGGVFVPADAYARFLRDRIGAQNVIFVSGTDCYGSPIAEGYRKLVENGYEGTIETYVQGNHDAQKAALDAYGISLDIFEGSGLGLCKEAHRTMTDRIFHRLHENAWLERLTTAQFYDETAGTFLNGRQVIGRCPVQGCKSEKAYADECDLGHQYMPADLIAPRSSVTGETPAMRDVSNWYFKLADFRDLLTAHVDSIEKRETTRPVVCNTIREFLVPPIIYIKNENEADFRALEARLPKHDFRAAEKGKASFEIEFATLEDRDLARTVLGEAGIRYRTGKALTPFRLTGNIAWGVPAPQLEGEEALTVWCWPESLWAPISFTDAYLREHERPAAPVWNDWWCSDDATVYQFIGQDNIYFYGVAQTALWSALQEGHEPRPDGTGGELRQSTLVANYHVLFMNKKASSSGAIKPPMAADLLDHYTPEQLRAHFLALGLGLKSVSFQPKPYDADALAREAKGEKVGDPVLKEGSLLTNVFNRVARSCFYTAQKHYEGTLPLGPISPDVQACAERLILEYEQAMYRFEFWSVMALMDGYIRAANKQWTDRIRAAEEADDGDARAQAVRDTFHMLRVMTVLMHPIAPHGTEMIVDYLELEEGGDGFFSWEHVFEGMEAFCTEDERVAGRHRLKEVPPRTDFFEKHPSQYA